MVGNLKLSNPYKNKHFNVLFIVDQVSGWSRQRGNRLRDGLATLRRNNQLLEELIAWLNTAETKLFNENSEPIPDDTDVINTLIAEHQVRGYTATEFALDESWKEIKEIALNFISLLPIFYSNISFVRL